jgi:hypothetical protein
MPASNPQFPPLYVSLNISSKKIDSRARTLDETTEETLAKHANPSIIRISYASCGASSAHNLKELRLPETLSHQVTLYQTTFDTPY